MGCTELSGLNSAFFVVQSGRQNITKRKGNPAQVTVISSTLELRNITVEDKGVYTCRAEIIPTKYKHATAKVIVYGEHNLRKKKKRKKNDVPCC